MGQGRQILYPENVHPETGKFYKWMEGRDIQEKHIFPFPDALKDFFFKGVELKEHKYTQEVKEKKAPVKNQWREW